MSSNLKQQWLDVLRSGKYKQHFGWYLSKNGNVCALGVLMAETNCYVLSELNNLLSDMWPNTGRQKALAIAAANDGQRLSFPAIAEMIESWPDDEIPVAAQTDAVKELANV
jgi:hypothetical protein